MIKTNQNKFVIKHNGFIVSGFSRRFQGIVQFAGVGGIPKIFPTQQKAKDFIAKYADIGCGLCSETAEIVSL